MSESFITGVDVSEYSIKAVMIRANKGRYSVKSCIELHATTSLFSADGRFNTFEIANKLAELKNNLPKRCTNVAHFLPEQLVFNLVVSIDPGLKNTDLQFAVQQALSLESSIPLDDLSIDFVSREKDNNTEVNNVHVYATYRQVVEDRIETFKESGFTLRLIQSENMALMQLLSLITHYWSNQASQNEQSHSLLHIEQSRSLFCFVDSTQIHQCKTIEFGILQLNELGMNEFIKQLKVFIDPFIKGELVAKSVVQPHQVWLSSDGAGSQEDEQKIVSEFKLVMSMERVIKLDRLVLSDLFIGELDTNYLNGFAKTIGVAISGLTWKGAM
ncbi:pilus assembly protein PilM [Vibrio sp. TH_r3]|uniref:pilus assembly protein PilM n=1 Tax=Vibrio sp. TH_r3 TaxID=3082084 RepID=UPI002955D0CD|nr:pilus assembly protein PilM [Vibrio sp. TH_r3]MDV7104235.1 pilus assembly protein PilM [Vibrio sp. TH_r3]